MGLIMRRGNRNKSWNIPNWLQESLLGLFLGFLLVLFIAEILYGIFYS
jgi:hypothetical protein